MVLIKHTITLPLVGTLNQDTTGTAGGLTGTPDITVNNITGAAVTFTGVLTYEDVTNVDSIGVITARSGIIWCCWCWWNHFS